MSGALGLSSVWVDPDFIAELREAVKSDDYGIDDYRQLLSDWHMAFAKAQYSARLLPTPASELLLNALNEILEEVLRMGIERAVFKTIIKPTNL